MKRGKEFYFFKENGVDYFFFRSNIYSNYEEWTNTCRNNIAMIKNKEEVNFKNIINKLNMKEITTLNLENFNASVYKKNSLEITEIKINNNNGFKIYVVKDNDEIIYNTHF